MEDSHKTPRASHRCILIVNPNGNPEVTARIQDCADRVLGPDSRALVIQPKESPYSIETPADRACAEPLVLDLLAQNHGYNAYVIACFDDIAVTPARRCMSMPVIDAVEAAILAARALVWRFSIVTTVDTMVPGIQALVDRYGASGQCTVHAAGVGVAAAAEGKPEALSRLNAAIIQAREIDGAEAIILGSGGLAGHAARLSLEHGLPVIDCIEAAIMRADSKARGALTP